MSSKVELSPTQCPAHLSKAGENPVVEPGVPALAPHFVVISQFTVANGMTSEIKEAFRNREHKVDSTDGFLRMEVISPLDNPSEIWLVTFWRDEASFTAWHHSHSYRESHRGIPKGLKLVPKSASIRRFEGVSS